ncbi:hypothetical protein K443DRAFT_480912, partial [Laccaria amethystina LaAM-08-1]
MLRITRQNVSQPAWWLARREKPSKVRDRMAFLACYIIPGSRSGIKQMTEMTEKNSIE